MVGVNGKVALVTGGARGIGRAIALRLARDGAKVMIVGRDMSALVATAQCLGTENGLEVKQADLRDSHACAEVVQACAQRHERIDILVNNAAIPGPQVPIEDCSTEDWSLTMDVNLRAPFVCAKAAIPWMKRHGFGRIVNIGSGAGVQPMVQSGPYGVSKAGLVMLTRILSAELGRNGITANCVLPGLVLTEMITRNLDKVSQHAGMDAKEFIRMTVGASHFNHVGRPTREEEVAATVAFLCSEEAAAITGEVLNHSGGWF